MNFGPPRNRKLPNRTALKQRLAPVWRTFLAAWNDDVTNGRVKVPPIPPEPIDQMARRSGCLPGAFQKVAMESNIRLNRPTGLATLASQFYLFDDSVQLSEVILGEVVEYEIQRSLA